VKPRYAQPGGKRGPSCSVGEVIVDDVDGDNAKKGVERGEGM
jgi:hypothetical protein